MSETRWPRVKELLGQALDLPEGERIAFLERACASEPDLLREVSALLEIPADRLELFDRIHFQLATASGSGTRLEIGDRVGTYHIVEELERGGMGAVYKAQDEERGRPVAIKVLHRREEDVPLREARLLARLNHGNIARLYDSGTTPEGDPYFVMEHVEGAPLDRYCDERRLSIPERLRLFRKVCSAVEFAHRNQIVHRDLKPDNILVTPEGEPKLLDFGISKLLDPDGERPMAGTTVRPGALTPTFASPEQVAQERTNTATDIYSLGVILHLLLTGRLPYAVQNPHEIYWTIKEIDPERPSRIVELDEERLGAHGVVRFHEAEAIAGLRRLTPKLLSRRLRGDLDVILLHALRKEPERRYRTVQELSDEVERHLKDEPIRACQASAVYRVRKLLKRNRLAAAVTGVLLVANFATLVDLALARAESEAARRRAELSAEEARNEQRRAEEVTRFLVESFDASNPLRTAGEVESVAELLNRFTARIHTADLDPDVRARLTATIAFAYRGQGLFDEAARVLESMLKRMEDEAGPGSMPVATVMDGLGVLEHKRGNFERAEALLREALEIFQANLPADSVDIADGWDELGLTLYKAGRIREAIEASQRAVELLERSGDRDAAVDLLPSTLANLGLLLFETGDLTRAEAVQRRALKLVEQRYGAAHPNYAIAANNLAKTLVEQDRFAQAAELLRIAVAIHELNLDEDHPDLLATRNNLAAARYYSGDSRGAVAVQEGIVAQMEAKLGLDHPATIATRQNLGRFRVAAGDVEGGRRELERALHQARAALGEDHWLTANAALRLGAVLAQTGELAQADRLLESARATFEASHGSDHYRTLEAAIEHARVLAYRGDPLSAETLARKTHGLLRETVGEGHWRTAAAEGVLGEILARSGRYAEAERLLAQSVRHLQAVQGKDGPHAREIAQVLAEVRRAAGSAELARPRPQEALAARR